MVDRKMSLSQWNALTKIMRLLPSQSLYYGSALGVLVLAVGGDLPSGLEFVASGIGANLLANLIDDIVHGEKISNDEIQRRADDAISKSDIANHLTKQDFLQVYTHFIQRLNEQNQLNDNLLHTLGEGFSAAATKEQIEELKQILLQWTQSQSSRELELQSAFISYARKDAKPFAQRLYRELKEKGVEAWLDLEEMPSGDTFIAEIDRAIEQADYFLLVASPKAIESEFCRDEWKKALAKYKPIIPLLLIGDYSDLPTEANTDLHDSRDFRLEDYYAHEFERLLDQLRIVPRTAAQLRGVPDLPRHYLIREIEVATLGHELTKHKTTVLTSVSKKIGIQGMGGIGKSVLAAALTRDYFVRRTFTDGVYWLTFGTNPSLVQIWSRLRNWLGGGTGQFNTEDDARDYFEQATTDKECLIILDDVWKSEDAGAFTRLGERCHLLITSRHATVLNELDTYCYELGLLSNQEARSLLAETAELAESALPSEAEAIIATCGNLPLALSMIGAMVRGRPRSYWQDALKALEEADLQEIGAKFPDYPYPNLFAAIEVSVNALDADLRERYYDFAVFPDDVAISEDVLVTFWKPVAGHEARKKLDELVNRSLLQRSEHGLLTIHDLQLAFIRKQAGDVKARHGRLLENYNPNHSKWYVVADEYLLLHLGHHLSILDRRDEFIRTLVDTRDWLDKKFIICQGDSAYLDDLAIVSRSLADARSARDILVLSQVCAARHVVQQRTAQYDDMDLQTLVWIGREAEATSHARLRLDAAERLGGLLTVFLAMWAKSPNNETRLNELINEIKIAFDNGVGQDFHGGIFVHTAIAHILMKHPEEALQVAFQYNETVGLWRKDDLLAEVGIHLTTHDFPDFAWEIVQKIEDQRHRDKLIYHITKSHISQTSPNNTMALISQIHASDIQVYALCDAASGFTHNGESEWAKRAFQQASDILSSSSSIRSVLRELGYLARKLAENKYDPARVQEILSNLEEEFKDTAFAVWTVERMVDTASTYLLVGDADKANFLMSKAFATACRIEVHDTDNYFDDSMQADALKYIAKRHIEVKDFKTAITVIQSIQSEWRRVEMLCELSFHAKTNGEEFASIVEEATVICEGMNEKYWQKHCLRYLALTQARLGNPQKAKIMLEQLLGLEERPVSDLDWIRREALGNISYSFAKNGSIAQAFNIAEKIDSAYERINTLCSIARLSHDLGKVSEASQAISSAHNLLNSVEDEEQRTLADNHIYRATVLLGLDNEQYEYDKKDYTEVSTDQIIITECSQLLFMDEIEEATKLIAKAKISTQKIIILCRLASQNSETNSHKSDRLVEILNEYLSYVLQNETDFQLLTQFMHYMTVAGMFESMEQLLTKAKNAAFEINDAKKRSQSVVKLIGFALKAQRLNTAEELHRLISTEEHSVAGLCDLANYYLQIGEEQRFISTLEEIQNKIADIKDIDAQGRGFQNYVGVLSKGKQYEKAAEVIENIPHEDSRENAKSTLAQCLAEDRQFAKAEQIAREIQKDYHKSRAIDAIVRSKQKNGDLEGALAILRSIDCTEDWCVRTILDFADDIVKSGHITEGQELIHYARSLIRKLKHNTGRNSAGDHLLYMYINNKNFYGFFDTLGAQFVDVFVRAVARYWANFDEIEAGLSIQIIYQITRIAAWMQPFWDDIYRSIDVSKTS